MHAIIDLDTCTGCGLCTDICPEVFELSGDVAVVKADPVPEECQDACEESKDSCPVEAISLES